MKNWISFRYNDTTLYVFKHEDNSLWFSIAGLLQCLKDGLPEVTDETVYSSMLEVDRCTEPVKGKLIKVCSIAAAFDICSITTLQSHINLRKFLQDDVLPKAYKWGADESKIDYLLQEIENLRFEHRKMPVQHSYSLSGMAFAKPTISGTVDNRLVLSKTEKDISLSNKDRFYKLSDVQKILGMKRANFFKWIERKKFVYRGDDRRKDHKASLYPHSSMTNLAYMVVVPRSYKDTDTKDTLRKVQTRVTSNGLKFLWNEAMNDGIVSASLLPDS